MGGIKSETDNNITYRIWEFCIDKTFWISAAHIPSSQNEEADDQS